MDVALLLGFLVLVAVALGVTEWRRSAAGAVRSDDTPSGASYQLGTAAKLGLDRAGQLGRSLWIWAGVAVGVAIVAVEGRPAYPGALTVGLFTPLMLGLVVAVYVAVGRDRDADAADLDSGAVSPGTSTVGHVVAAAVVAGVLGAVFALGVMVAAGPGALFDGWEPRALEVIQPLTALVVMATLAVGAARWWPHPAAALAVLVVVVFSPFGWVLELHHHTGRRPSDQSGQLALVPGRELAWHMVFLAGFYLLGLGIALLRHDRRVPVLALLAVAAVAMGGGYTLRAL